jgi:hypothetical protein
VFAAGTVAVVVGATVVLAAAVVLLVLVVLLAMLVLLPEERYRAAHRQEPRASLLERLELPAQTKRRANIVGVQTHYDVADRQRQAL